MSDEQVRLHFELIRQRIAALQKEDLTEWKEINAALEDLQVMYEEMQTHLEVAEAVKEEVLQQNQRIATGYHHYQDLFQASPIAYLITDTQGLILEANQAIEPLLNLPPQHLIGKPLILYVAEGDRSDFCFKLNQFSSQSCQAEVCQINFCLPDGKRLPVELQINAIPNEAGLIQWLRIGMHDISQFSQPMAQFTQSQLIGEIQVDRTKPMSFPQSLNGLQVLIIDDEADAREFITVVLESYGVTVKAVASAAAALKELEQFQPDVLMSDIRMPDQDGYSLIRQIRARESTWGNHIPAAAITAYLDEDQNKILSAGFEAHLHKLAQPSEWIEMIAHLAGRSSNLDWNGLN